MNPVDNLSPAFAHRAPHRSTTHKAEEVTSHRPEKAENGGDADDNSASKGVLRLIQEDHFKGVAEARLRINFYEQLVALKNVNTTEQTQGAATTLANTVADIAAQQDGMPEDVAAAISDFQNTLSGLTSPDRERTGSLAENVNNVFSTLATSLRDMLGLNELTAPAESSVQSAPVADATESAANETATQASDSSIAFDGAAFLAALESAFDVFQAGLSAETQPHEFTPPNGNGTAFDKFVSMYRDLAYRSEQAPANHSSDSVDQQV